MKVKVLILEGDVTWLNKIKLERQIEKIINEDIYETDNTLFTYLNKLLHDLGMPSNVKGFQYVTHAILMVYENPLLGSKITKILYPNISSKYNTSVAGVERNIRHSIDISWLRGDIDLMQEIFGNSISIEKARPTNSEYIVTIADKLRLDMNKTK